MSKILKMDLHRLIHSVVFYVSIIFVTVMAFAQVKSGMSVTLDSLLGAVFTRNMAWGIFFGFLIAAGGLAMGISLLAQFLGWNWLISFFSITISGASALCSLVFSQMVLLRVVAAGAAWIVICCVASHRVLKSKDL